MIIFYRQFKKKINIAEISIDNSFAHNVISDFFINFIEYRF